MVLALVSEIFFKILFATTYLRQRHCDVFFNSSGIALSVDKMVVPSSTQWLNGATGDASAQDCKICHQDPEIREFTWSARGPWASVLYALP